MIEQQKVICIYWQVKNVVNLFRHIPFEVLNIKFAIDVIFSFQLRAIECVSV